VARGQQGGQDGPADGAGQVDGPSGQMLRAAVSWSRAASMAVVKLARSGSVPGRVSTASTMAIRSSWYSVSSAHVSCSRPGQHA
jgi:hypothetical protein